DRHPAHRQRKKPAQPTPIESAATVHSTFARALHLSPCGVGPSRSSLLTAPSPKLNTCPLALKVSLESTPVVREQESSVHEIREHRSATILASVQGIAASDHQEVISLQAPSHQLRAATNSACIC